MTPVNTSEVWSRDYSSPFLGESTPTYSRAIHPVVNLKAAISLSESGTKTDPYTINTW